MRIRRNKEEVVKVVEQYRASGQTRVELGPRSGIALSTLSNYGRRLKSRGLVRVNLQEQAFIRVLKAAICGDLKLTAIFEISVHTICHKNEYTSVQFLLLGLNPAKMEKLLSTLHIAKTVLRDLN